MGTYVSDTWVHGRRCGVGAFPTFIAAAESRAEQSRAEQRGGGIDDGRKVPQFLALTRAQTLATTSADVVRSGSRAGTG